MLGGPSCPPRKVTDRATIAPLIIRLLRDQRQEPDSSVVGEPIAKCISIVSMDELSLNTAWACKRSPSRVPRSDCNLKSARSSCVVRSSTAGRFVPPQAARSSAPHNNLDLEFSVMRLYTPLGRTCYFGDSDPMPNLVPITVAL